MRELNLAGFVRSKRRLETLFDMCSEIICDPATTPGRKAEVLTFRRWLHSERIDQSHPNAAHVDEAYRRAAVLLGKPALAENLPAAPLQAG